jgi:hypothetical protein
MNEQPGRGASVDAGSEGGHLCGGFMVFFFLSLQMININESHLDSAKTRAVWGPAACG